MHSCLFCSSIALWAVVKKKPLVKRAHSSEEEGEKGEGVGEGWVTAVAAFPNSDLVASGVCVYVCLHSGRMSFQRLHNALY